MLIWVHWSHQKHWIAANRLMMDMETKALRPVTTIVLGVEGAQLKAGMMLTVCDEYLAERALGTSYSDAMLQVCDVMRRFYIREKWFGTIITTLIHKMSMTRAERNTI
jgi:hypothetical protein